MHHRDNPITIDMHLAQIVYAETIVGHGARPRWDSAGENPDMEKPRGSFRYIILWLEVKKNARLICMKCELDKNGSYRADGEPTHF